MIPVEWRPVVGFEGLYEVSNTGLVRSIDRVLHLSNRTYRRQGVLLKPTVRHRGHLSVSLRRPGSKRVVFIHVLVLEAFVGPRPDGMQCCHWDDNPSNNNLSNLRWDTCSANKFDSVRNGTHTNAAKTHCKQGHEFTPENTWYRNNGRWRVCATCSTAKRDDWRRRRREAGLVAS